MTLDQQLRQASEEVHRAVAGHKGAPVAKLASRAMAVRVTAVAAAIIVVTVGAGTLALRDAGSTSDSVVGAQEPTATTVPLTDEVIAAATPVAASAFDGFSAVRRVESTGELFGIRNDSISRSTDGGETWTLFYGEPGQMIEAIDVSSDGAIVAVENLNDVHKGELGPDSVSNDGPRVHPYDPESDQWRVVNLPRPSLPIANLAPAPMDGTGPCVLGGLQSWVDGTAAAFGSEMVIVGVHRVNGENVCDEAFQLLWTSTNGLDWTIVPETGADAFLTGLVWDGDSYIGYGTPLPQGPGVDRAEFTNAESSLGIFTTTDLSTWTQVPLDLLVLPDNTVINAPGSTSRNSGIRMAGSVPTSDGTVAFTFPVLYRLPGPGMDLPDVDALHQWLLDSRLILETDTTDTVQQTLDMLGVDFPLDTRDVQLLATFYLTELDQIGRLVVEQTTDAAWTTTYLADGPGAGSDESPSTPTTPSDSFEDLAPELLTGTSISDKEFTALIGPSALVPGTARRLAWTELRNGATLGLFTSRDGSALDEEPMFCLWDYSSVLGGGGAQCAPSAEAFAQLLEFGIGGGGSCFKPMSHMASVWGLPDSTDVVSFELSDGTVLEAQATNGIAQILWDHDVTVSRVRFGGATPDQITYVEDFLGVNQATCAELDASTGGG